MKVALVSPYSLRVFGGVQTQVLGLARALSGSSEVVVLAPEAQAAQMREPFEIADVGPTLSVPVNGSRAPIALSRRAWGRTRAALRQLSPDVVHVHEPFVPAVGIASLYSGYPVVATFHRAGTGPGYRAVGPLLGRLATRIGAASAVSDAAAATLRAVLGATAGPLPILPNGIDPASYAGPAKDPANGGSTLLFVGRLEHRKGLSTLLAALAFLDDRVSLEVIGAGAEHGSLRTRSDLEPRVTFLGAVDDTEKARRLRAADLFIAPSLGGESFGVILLEAMAAETPVVASDLDGYRLAGGDAAEFAPAGDARALADAIQRLLGDEGRRRELVRRGAARAEAHSFEQLAARYQELYSEAIAGARWTAGA